MLDVPTMHHMHGNRPMNHATCLLSHPLSLTNSVNTNSALAVLPITSMIMNNTMNIIMCSVPEKSSNPGSSKMPQIFWIQEIRTISHIIRVVCQRLKP